MSEDSKTSSKKLGLQTPKGYQSLATDEQFDALKDVISDWAVTHKVDHASAVTMLIAMAALESYMNWEETTASPSELLRRVSSFYVEDLAADERRVFEGNTKTNRTIN